MIQRLTILLQTILSITCITAQELNCRVAVDYSQVQGTGTSVFTTLEKEISDYINTRKWTSAQIAHDEKIDCTLFLTVNSYNEPSISGNLQVQSIRPVFNSTYTTTLLNFKDDAISFVYHEGEPLTYSETSVDSNLTAIIDFYVWLLLGMDFDSFSPRGGDTYYRKAEAVVRLAQSTGDRQWRPFDDNRNRSALLSVFTDAPTSRIRDIIYSYHREGLDMMSMSPAKGRAAITKSLDILKEVYTASPMSLSTILFRDAKLEELINVYTEGSTDERSHVYNVLSTVYPSEVLRFETIKQGVNR